jgi:hypothetical protein
MDAIIGLSILAAFVLFVILVKRKQSKNSKPNTGGGSGGGWSDSGDDQIDKPNDGLTKEDIRKY